MKYTTMQQLFYRVAIHLLIQAKVSNVRGACAYRGDDGLMCAVGCLISDEFYYPEIEDKPVSNKEVLAVLGKSLGKKLSEAQETLLGNLLDIHDLESSQTWHGKLLQLAKDYNFNTDTLDFALEVKEGMTW